MVPQEPESPNKRAPQREKPIDRPECKARRGPERSVLLYVSTGPHEQRRNRAEQSVFTSRPGGGRDGHADYWCFGWHRLP